MCIALFSCASTESYETESTPYEERPSSARTRQPVRPTADGYAEYPEGFVPESRWTSVTWGFYRTPEELIEFTNLILIGTIVDAQFEWWPSQSHSRDFEPVMVYNIAVSRVLKTDIEVGETIEVKTMIDYRDVITISPDTERLEVGGEFLFALGTLADMRVLDPANEWMLMPSYINPWQWAMPIGEGERYFEGFNVTRFAADDIIALFE